MYNYVANAFTHTHKHYAMTALDVISMPISPLSVHMCSHCIESTRHIVAWPPGPYCRLQASIARSGLNAWCVRCRQLYVPARPPITPLGRQMPAISSSNSSTVSSFRCLSRFCFVLVFVSFGGAGGTRRPIGSRLDFGGLLCLWK